MHAGSPNRRSTTDPLTSSECAAKSLFRKILAVSPCGSRFCTDRAPSPSSNCLKMNTLATSTKKHRGESEAKSLSQKILTVSPCGSGFYADIGLSQAYKSLRMNSLWIMKKKKYRSARLTSAGLGLWRPTGGFLHPAVACAPASVGMTTLRSTRTLRSSAEER
jgi:hypothetical protein